MTAPTISSVSGMIETGQILTVSGANLYRGGANENTTGWALTEDEALMKGATPGGDGWTLDPSAGNYDGTKRLIVGSKSVRNDTAGETTENHTARFYRSSASLSGDIFFAGYILGQYAGGVYPDNYRKQLSLYSTPPCWWLLKGEVGAPFSGMLLDVNGTARGSVSIPGGGWQDDRWYWIMSRFPANAADPWEGHICNQSVEYVHSVGNGGLNDEFDTNHAGNPAGFSASHYWNRVILSNQRIYEACKFEVSDDATYGNGTVNYCFPVSIDDGQGQFKLNLSDLGAGPYYLFVTNSRNERVATPYTLGGVQDSGEIILSL